MQAAATRNEDRLTVSGPDGRVTRSIAAHGIEITPLEAIR